jgi:hypothetical protein
MNMPQEILMLLPKVQRDIKPTAANFSQEVAVFLRLCCEKNPVSQPEGILQSGRKLQENT